MGGDVGGGEVESAGGVERSCVVACRSMGAISFEQGGEFREGVAPFGTLTP